MPDALDLLKTRRTVAALQLGDPGPSEDEIRELVTIAARVPDHGKLAPWRFVLYRRADGPALAERLMPLYHARFPNAEPARVEQERGLFARSPITIGVISKAGEHPKIPEWEQVLSGGASAMNLVIAAHAMGYAAQWLTGWCAYDPEAAAILGAKAGERFVGFVHIGTPKEKPAERPRPAVDDVLTVWSA
ncbi:nitroreductase family protein [Prosthecomicrobium sp. N25]|uniref:nitroreductase family protein n=1 Tax=Prosthecomicrobium sp. N25 TaxID=3129254 RepID=UPI0030777F2E